MLQIQHLQIVFINQILSWNCAEATSFDVYFGTETTPVFVQNQTEFSYNPGILEYNTTYYWKIISKNEHGSATGCEIWNFTTGNNAEYCMPYSDCEYLLDELESFYMEDLVHDNSSCSDDYGVYGYGDFTESGYTTDLVQGVSITWTADHAGQSALAIWIDFNDDGVFNATDEFVYHTELVNGNFVHITTDNFTLPADCQLGTHRLRVRSIADVAYFIGEWACQDFTYGETHDYIITIVEATEVPQCAVNPTPENGATEQYLNIELSWEASLATSYDVYFGTTELNYIGEIYEMTYTPEILEPNTTYQWKIIPRNNVGNATGCDTWNFTTGEDLNYCDSYLYTGDSYSDPCDWRDYIEALSISDLELTDLSCINEYGAIDYTDMTINFERGDTYTWTASFGLEHQYIAFWVDSNNNGNFEEDELLYTSEVFIPGTSITDELTIPITTAIGEHRLRVRLRGGGPNPILPSDACTIFMYGQTYDFTANISGIVNISDITENINIYPNPASNFVTIETGSNIENIYIYNTVGQIVSVSKLQNFKTSKIEIDVSNLQSGIYFLNIETENGSFVKQLIIQ